MGFERGQDTGTLEGVIRAAFRNLEADLYTALPGKVESIDQDTRLVTVKPMISRRYFGASTPTELPVIVGVPLVEMRTQKAFLSMPVTKGDPVLMVFGDRALDNYIESAGAAPVEPLDVRMHDITDAFAILGGWPIQKQDAVPAPNGDGVELLLAPGVKLAMGNETAELLDLIDQQLDAITAHFHIGFAGVPTAPPDSATLTTITNIKTLLATLKDGTSA